MNRKVIKKLSKKKIIKSYQQKVIKIPPEKMRIQNFNGYSGSYLQQEITIEYKCYQKGRKQVQ